jgi:hypothetical protein
MTNTTQELLSRANGSTVIKEAGIGSERAKKLQTSFKLAVRI